MPRSCCVVGCKTGYKSNHSTIKVSTFSFPTDENLKKKWINKIPRKDLIATKNSVVCASHFTDEQIIRTWTSGVGDKQVCINLKYPKLKEDAIPCIFPGPKYLSNPQTKRKSPRKRDSSLISSKNIKVVEAESKISEHPCNNDIDPEFSEESSVLSTEQKFEKICCDLESITLPDNWKYEIHRGKKPYIVLYTIQCNNNEAGISIEKQIFLDSDMILKCNIYEKNINLQDLYGNSNISSLDDLISIMIILSSKKICSGGPLVHEFEGISVECADIIFKNHWQHKKCPYLIDKSSIKNKCSFFKMDAR
ncbi:THAP domain-containing protein 6-like [Acyrthosiphon pisum]|uniref:THAP-type domain-containing protein n=1 Tax=Acyrthosiphon pisum TaxID=7029 RepID=A0A8R2NJ20_ACYPI|nr:THAP domain-containing protein 6-like [Acyrthosiphon pisum]